jgi:hypothetical protein
MAQYKEMLGAVELTDIQLGNAVYHDYFYIPVFTCIEDDDDYQTHEFRLELELNDGSFDPKGYASKVIKGETLWQTIKNDLQNDFAYTDWFKITSIKPFDSIDNKNGQPLDRFLVYVFLFKKFDATKVNPLGLQCRWSELANS